MRLLVYALGGGLGHLQRSIALCRAASRRGHASTILTNSPAWPRIRDRMPRADIRVDHLTGDDAAVLSAASQRVQAIEYDALVVDTLPRGIAGELSDRLPATATVFVHRDLTLDYANQPDVVRAANDYQLMICPGEQGPLPHHNKTRTEPWVCFDHDELTPRTAARQCFECPADQPLVVVCDSVDRDEAAGLLTIADRLRTKFGGDACVRSANLETTWPLQQLHLGIDLLVGSAGYNTVHEARLTGTPLRAIPRERLYDRQQRRLRTNEWLEGLDLELAMRPRGSARYGNGAHAAVDAIEDLIAAAQ